MNVDNFKPEKVVSFSPFGHSAQNDVYLLPKELVETVAKLHFLTLSAELNVPTQTQTDCTGVKVEGPLKGCVPSRTRFRSSLFLLRNLLAPGLQQRRLLPSGKARRESGDVSFPCSTRSPLSSLRFKQIMNGVKVEHSFQANKNDVFLLPNELDEKVPKLHFLALKFRISCS